MNELLTWKSMTTYAGSVLAVGIVTQFLKDFGLFKRIPTRMFSYAISMVLLTLADGFTCGLTFERAALIPINAMMVSLAANGAYDAMNGRKLPPHTGGHSKPDGQHDAGRAEETHNKKG